MGRCGFSGGLSPWPTDGCLLLGSSLSPDSAHSCASSSSHKDLNHEPTGPTHMTSFNHNYLLKGLFPTICNKKFLENVYNEKTHGFQKFGSKIILSFQSIFRNFFSALVTVTFRGIGGANVSTYILGSHTPVPRKLKSQSEPCSSSTSQTCTCMTPQRNLTKCRC